MRPNRRGAAAHPSGMTRASVFTSFTSFTSFTILSMLSSSAVVVLGAGCRPDRMDAGFGALSGTGESGADADGPGGTAGTGAADDTTGGGGRESDDDADPDHTDDDSDADDTDDNDSDGPKLDVAGGMGEPSACGPGVSSSIYLLDVGNEYPPVPKLHRFDPETFQTEELGILDCGNFMPMAMTIDRDEGLWITGMLDEQDSVLLRLDPETLACTPTGVAPPPDKTFGGLAFVADEPDSEEETLVISLLDPVFSSTTPLTLGRYEQDTGDLEVIGDMPIVPTEYYQVADLTGTGAGELFGLFAGDVAYVATIDDADATATSQSLGAGVGSPWAFAQWEGRLWIFSGGFVRAFDPQTGDIEVLTESLGVSAAGAAVSTCAPYEPEG